MGKLPQIVAMGGGGFSMEPDNLLLDRFVLSRSCVKEPRICFVPTASGDAEGYIASFQAAFSRLPCRATQLSLFRPPTADLRSFVLEQDVIYVGGGSTRNLLALWRDWGLDILFKEAWENGVVLAGISAGSLCWFEGGVSDSVRAGQYRPIRCLGFLAGSHCPHYDGEPERRPAYHRMIEQGKLSAGYAADDGAALHFVGQELFRVVSSRPEAKAYALRWTGIQVEEVILETEVLSSAQTTREHPRV